MDELNQLLLKGQADKKQCKNIEAIVALIKDSIELILGTDTEYTWQVLYAPGTSPFKIPCLHLKRIIQNIVKNSKEAMPDGGHLSISIKNILLEDNLPNGYQSGRYVHISIRDSGTGISEERLNNLFHSGLTTKENGNGLGLKITRYLIQINGGFIRVVSKPGYGTLLNIFFPASES